MANVIRQRAVTSATSTFVDGDTDESRKIISDRVLFYCTTYLTIVLTSVISSLGVIANILNMIVYWKQGTKDNVNVTFMALSLWDFGVCFLSVLASACFVLEIYFPSPNIDYMSILYVYIAYARGLMYVLSTIVTVYLSIERCVCIILPFRIKEIFPKSRVVLANVMFVFFGVAFIGPAWATQGVQWEFNLRHNMTRLTLWLSVNRRDIDLFVDTFNGMVLPVVAQVLITVSAGFMIQGITKSVKFRQPSANIMKSKTTNYNEETVQATSALQSLNKAMTSKDVKLTKVIVLLAFIFFFCNLPVFLVAFIRTMIPELDIGKGQYNLYIVLYAAVYQCVLINSTVSIFVYYNFSTRYRREFLTMFCRLLAP
ncbi:unnamed protein product [Candidula unifasciata]|uniref:G-protein coupled receptors family 1 profile domain-containing protein n=1 Tax=Candidula unifasciata TaxID=100452 RepID=A0A8S3ZTX2_9EUPU|nr:unnamed protein product [Candidula unifasciata]